jgi:hypothetical protein
MSDWRGTNIVSRELSGSATAGLDRAGGGRRPSLLLADEPRPNLDSTNTGDPPVARPAQRENGITVSTPHTMRKVSGKRSSNCCPEGRTNHRGSHMLTCNDVLKTYSLKNTLNHHNSG